MIEFYAVFKKWRDSFRSGKKLLPAILFYTPAISAQNVNLILQPASNLIVSNGNMVLNNTDLRINGALTAGNAAVYFTGTNSTTLSGTGTTSIGDLNLNKSAATTLILAAPLSVSSSLNFQQGILELNNNQIYLTGNAAILFENETKYITGITGGSITASAPAVNNPNQLNLANLGAVITSTSNLGNLTITRSHKPAVNPADAGKHGVERTFLIQPQNNSALNATLRFYYLDKELNGNNASTLSLWKSSDGINWNHIGADSWNTVNKYVEKTGIADFSYWTISSDAMPLPMTLLSFKTTCGNRAAVVQWQTGVEMDMDRFAVERSVDGGRWAELGVVTAFNSPLGSTYSYTDKDPQPMAYYRLKLIEKNGSINYSPVFKGGCSDVALPFIVYPNPVQSQALAQVSVRKLTDAVLKVQNLEGREMYTSKWKLTPGINQLVVPVSEFATGTYIVQLIMDNKTLHAKLIKK